MLESHGVQFKPLEQDSLLKVVRRTSKKRSIRRRKMKTVLHRPEVSVL